jgi:hypothetical protein
MRRGYRKRPVDREFSFPSIGPGPLQMRGIGEKSWSGEMASGKNQIPEMQIWRMGVHSEEEGALKNRRCEHAVIPSPRRAWFRTKMCDKWDKLENFDLIKQTLRARNQTERGRYVKATEKATQNYRSVTRARRAGFLGLKILQPPGDSSKLQCCWFRHLPAGKFTLALTSSPPTEKPNDSCRRGTSRVRMFCNFLL